MKRDFNRANALRLAEAGVPVFPCDPDKKPKVKWREASTSDPEAVATLWAQHPNALPGIDLGKAGLVVLDGDRHGDGPDGVANLRALLKQQGFDPSKCPIMKTPNNGIHIYFRQNGTALTNSRGALPAGVDIRGEGGYVIAPFAILPDGRTYEPVSTTPNIITAVTSGDIPHAPEWLADLVQGRPEDGEQVDNINSNPRPFRPPGTHEEKYARAALGGIADDVAAAPKGQRNETLNACAYRLGRMVARGWVDRGEVEHRLLAAAHANGMAKDDGRRAAEQTIRSGIDAGLKHPHDDLDDRGPGDKAADIVRSFKRGDGDENRSNEGTGFPGYQSNDATGSAPLAFTCLNSVEPRPVEWVWQRRVAKGKLTLIAGDPGMGKSQIVNDIIATITNGGAWPDAGHAPPGRCIMLSAEDAIADTIRPRLEAAGADLSKIDVLSAAYTDDGKRRTFSLQNDLAALEEKLNATGDVVLVTIDPITSYMGSIDSHRTTDVRAVLEPLSAFSERNNVAVIAVSHPPKAAQAKAIHAVTGSLAFVAAARLVFVAVEEPETERRLLLPVKNNLSAEADGIGYRLVQRQVTNDVVGSYIVWDRDPVMMTANEAVRASHSGHGSKVAEAEDLLREELSGGPVASDVIFVKAAAQKIGERTVRTAKKKLGVVASKDGFNAGWTWRLPG